MVERLGVSRTTVRTHLQAVLTKLGVHSRLEAASFAVRHRLPDIWSEDVPGAAASKVREIRSRQAAGRSASRGSGSATGRVGGSAAGHAARATRHLFPAAGQDAGTG